VDGLTHYTSSTEAVVSILSNGFAWVNNKRDIIKTLIPIHDFSDREPQQFGMISFTDSSPPAPTRHREKFGQFGIVVSHEWALSKMAQKVFYVAREGPITSALQELFGTGYRELKSQIKYPEDSAAQMAFTNKAMAQVHGGRLWSNLLTLYEYMEPMENAWHSEWRIVHKVPFYGYPSSKEAIIQNVSPPKNWAKIFNVVPVPEQAVIGFVCPSQHQQPFARALPSNFTSKEIIVSEG